eukprot:226190-Chlamydomonas_euryale.AAC.2
MAAAREGLAIGERRRAVRHRTRRRRHWPRLRNHACAFGTAGHCRRRCPDGCVCRACQRSRGATELARRVGVTAAVAGQPRPARRCGRRQACLRDVRVCMRAATCQRILSRAWRAPAEAAGSKCARAATAAAAAAAALFSPAVATMRPAGDGTAAAADARRCSGEPAAGLAAAA